MENLEVLLVNNSALIGTVLIVLIAVPFITFAYLLFPYGGIGSTHVDFAKTVTVPILDRTLENPFRQYVNWYWLAKKLALPISSSLFAVAMLPALKKRFRSLAIFYISIQTSILIREIWSPHGLYDWSSIVVMGLFSIAVYEFNSTKILNLFK